MKKEAPWKKQEKELARIFEGYRMPNSGGTLSPFKKGDVQTDSLLIEAKSTSAESYTIYLSMLNKIAREAQGVDKKAIMAVKFLKEKRDIREKRNFVVIDQDFFEELWSAYKKGQAQGARFHGKS